ncbi:MAG: hypothetical protein KAF91_20495 [Nostoc sp. TH1S01]|nr:hypothetical protein [Nostoc sp. TH1S01]
MSISNFGIIFRASNPSHTRVKKLLILSAPLCLCVRKFIPYLCNILHKIGDRLLTKHNNRLDGAIATAYDRQTNICYHQGNKLEGAYDTDNCG